jgi:hypothetical protein
MRREQNLPGSPDVRTVGREEPAHRIGDGARLNLGHERHGAWIIGRQAPE